MQKSRVIEYVCMQTKCEIKYIPTLSLQVRPYFKCEKKSGNCVWQSFIVKFLRFYPCDSWLKSESCHSVNFIENIRSKIQRLKIRDDSWTQQEFDGGLVKRKRGIHTQIDKGCRWYNSRSWTMSKPSISLTCHCITQSLLERVFTNATFLLLTS